MEPRERKIVAQVLDEYLLTGDVPLEDVEACLERHRRTRLLQHLKLAGLADGLPADEGARWDTLLKLRLLLAHIPDPDEALVRRLRFASTLLRLSSGYVTGEVNDRELERGLSGAAEHTRRKAGFEGARHLSFDARYCIAMLGAPASEGGTERLDLIAVCIGTVSRVRQYWGSVLG